MKLPAPPPDASAIFDRILDKGDHVKTIRFMKQPATDQDGRYLHWDKLRYLQPPEGFTAEEYWGAIKRARQTAYRKLPLLAKNREPFVYLVTDLMQRDLHQLDQRASGQILAPQPIVNEHTRKSYLVSTLIEESGGLRGTLVSSLSYLRVDTMITFGSSSFGLGWTLCGVVEDFRE